ncbi:MAG: hypothetical protein ABIG84_07600 [archaeon]
METMIETINNIARAFIPNANTLKIFAIFIILFFATLKNNPVEYAITTLTPLQLHQYHHTIAPFTPVEPEDFGTKQYCKEATGFIQCAILYPKENMQNIALWYTISALAAGLIARFSNRGNEP